MNRKVGFIQIIVSALIFGVSPLLTAITYNMGNNGMNMAFLRNLICIPILYIVVKVLKHSFKITVHQLFHIILASILGSAATTILLYTSYAYVSVGIATILHFTYPVFVVFLIMLFYQQKISRQKLLAVIFSFAGLLFFLDFNGSNQWLGLFLSTLSGLTYAFYIVWIQKTRLVDLSPFVLSFYLAIISSIFILFLNPFMNFITFEMNSFAWIIIILVSISTSFIATVLLQMGLKVIDGATASILCLLEPVSSFILGIMYQGDQLTLLKLVGFGLIVVSIVVITFEKEVRTN